MTSHITIGQKLIISFGGMLLLLLGMAYSSLTAIGSLGTQLAESTGKTIKKADLAGQITEANSEMRAAVRSEVLSAVLKNTAEFEKARAAFDHRARELESATAEMRPLLVSERGRRATEAIAADTKEFHVLEDQLARLCSAGNAEEANRLRVEKIVPLGD